MDNRLMRLTTIAFRSIVSSCGRLCLARPLSHWTACCAPSNQAHSSSQMLPFQWPSPVSWADWHPASRLRRPASSSRSHTSIREQLHARAGTSASRQTQLISTSVAPIQGSLSALSLRFCRHWSASSVLVLTSRVLLLLEFLFLRRHR